jgi:hypothetical protein
LTTTCQIVVELLYSFKQKKVNIKAQNNDKVLFILEKGPDAISANEIVTSLSQYLTNGNSITLFIHKAGVKWLSDQNWMNIYPGHESIVYYVNASDMHIYNIPYQNDVIISNPKIISQLINWSDHVYFFS